MQVSTEVVGLSLTMSPQGHSWVSAPTPFPPVTLCCHPGPCMAHLLATTFSCSLLNAANSLMFRILLAAPAQCRATQRSLDASVFVPIANFCVTPFNTRKISEAYGNHYRHPWKSLGAKQGPASPELLPNL